MATAWEQSAIDDHLMGNNTNDATKNMNEAGDGRCRSNCEHNDTDQFEHLMASQQQEENDIQCFDNNTNDASNDVEENRMDDESTAEACPTKNCELCCRTKSKKFLDLDAVVRGVENDILERIRKANVSLHPRKGDCVHAKFQKISERKYRLNFNALGDRNCGCEFDGLPVSSSSSSCVDKFTPNWRRASHSRRYMNSDQNIYQYGRKSFYEPFAKNYSIFRANRDL